MSWGIVVEWDERGLSCTKWMKTAAREPYRMIHFNTQDEADTFIADHLQGSGNADRIFTARRFK